MDEPAVALVGAGQMGGALVRGWIAAIRLGGGLKLTVLEPHFDPALQAELLAAGAILNPNTPGQTDVVVLAVKPQSFSDVVADARKFVGPQTLVLSVMAGVPMARIASEMGAERVVRAMPNTPGQIGRGVSAYVASPDCTADDRCLVEQLLAPLGIVEPIPEEGLMDAVTAVSGSGPAYVFLLAEALAAAGVAEGLDPETAQRLAHMTVAGAGALLLEEGKTPSALRKQVTSPGGTTQAALEVLTAPDGMEALLRRAVEAAAQRSRELAKS